MNKKWMYLLALVVVGFVAFYFYRKYNVAPGFNANSFALVDMNNEPVRLDELKGKKVIVCFSASWCGNCRTELQEINEVKEEHLKDVEVVVISDEPLERVQAFAQHLAYPFTFLKMDKHFNDIGIFSIPTSYLLNREQHVVKETVGYLNWKDPSTCENLKQLMDE